MSPSIFYEKLNPSQQKEIDEWMSKRNAMINDNVQKSITKSLQSEPGMQRKCSSFVRFYVRALTSKQKQQKSNEAMLTIWDPTEEQLEMLKEGVVFQCRFLGVTSSFKDGMLQLSAHRSTIIEKIDIHPPLQALQMVGYSKRKFDSLLRINIKSKKLNCNNVEPPELDCAGYFLETKEIELTNTTRLLLYMTDATGLLLRIENDDYNKSDTFIRDLKRMKQLEMKDRFLMLRNIRLLSFDYVQGCAVGVWTKSTDCSYRYSKMKQIGQNEHFVPPPTEEKSEFLLHKLNAGVPVGLKLPKSLSIAFGYVVDFVAKRSVTPYLNDIETTYQFHISIDCYGDEVILNALIPQHLLQSFLDTSLDENVQPHDASDVARNIHTLHERIVGRSILLRFLLQEINRHDDSYTLLEISKADTISLTKMQLMKETICAQSSRRRNSKSIF